MRRLTAVVLVAVAVLAVGCSSDKDEDPTAAAPTTDSTAPPGSTPPSTDPAIACNGLGPAPASGASETTWVDYDGRLWAIGADGAKRCLLDRLATEGARVAWGGGADRVLVGNKIVFADSRADELVDGGIAVLSRPTGKSVLQIRDGRLHKRELGKSPFEITFVSGHGDTVYHPAGRHIVSTGSADGRSLLQIADNQGQGAQDLVQNETAELIYSPAFTASGALLFFADHGTYTELHRLEIDGAKLTTVVKEDRPDGLAHLVTSPFEGGGVAWGQGACDAKSGGRLLRAQRNGVYLKTEGTAVERGEPVGWTPDGALLVITPGTCDAEGENLAAGAPPAEVERVLHRFKDGQATEVARRVQTAAVRAVLPPPPAPPTSISQQAPA